MIARKQKLFFFQILICFGQPKINLALTSKANLLHFEAFDNFEPAEFEYDYIYEDDYQDYYHAPKLWNDEVSIG